MRFCPTWTGGNQRGRALEWCNWARGSRSWDRSCVRNLRGEGGRGITLWYVLHPCRGTVSLTLQNVDFSLEAVRLGQETEDPKDAMQAMPWLHADLRSWRDITSILPFAPFDVIMDKSTCDAIATSEHQTFSPSSDRSNTSLAVLESISQTEPTTLSPVELLGLNLVPLTHEGTRWIALSYSSARFDNLGHLEGHWEVVSRAKMEAPSGLLSAAHAPKMYHWLYVLKRN